MPNVGRGIARTETGARAVSVAYLGGMGRSGSTILQSALGCAPGLVPLGEVRGVWRAFLLNERCGCGEPFRRCPFWTEVGRLAFGGWSVELATAMVQADEAVLRHRQLPGIVGVGRRSSASVSALRSRITELYAAAAHVSEARALIDSTKDAPYAILLDGALGIDLHVVHLIRDPRAVAFSWRRLVERPEYDGIDHLKGSHMERYGVVSASLQWNARNALFEALRRSGVPTVRVFYEDVVREPERVIPEVLRFLGTSSTASFSDGEFHNAASHTVGGNRARFVTGAVPFRRGCGLEARNGSRRSADLFDPVDAAPRVVRLWADWASVTRARPDRFVEYL